MGRAGKALKQALEKPRGKTEGLMLVISDTSPLCYLLLIDQIDLLPKIYGRVVISHCDRLICCHVACTIAKCC
jgi:hypothetical protein